MNKMKLTLGTQNLKKKRGGGEEKQRSFLLGFCNELEGITHETIIIGTEERNKEERKKEVKRTTL